MTTSIIITIDDSGFRSYHLSFPRLSSLLSLSLAHARALFLSRTATGGELTMRVNDAMGLSARDTFAPPRAAPFSATRERERGRDFPAPEEVSLIKLVGASASGSFSRRRLPAERHCLRNISAFIFDLYLCKWISAGNEVKRQKEEAFY